MNDDLDALLTGKTLAAPPDFAARLTALARVTPQLREPPRAVKPWQWVSLGVGAGVAGLRLCEFVLVAFVAAGAQ